MRAFLRALAAAAGTTIALAALALPLVRDGAASGAAVAWRLGGFAAATAVVVTLVHLPVMAIAGRLLHADSRGPGRPTLALGGALVMFAVFMLVPVAETASLAPIPWTIEGWMRRPAEFATDWLPFLAGGAVFSATGWAPRSRR